MNDERGSIRAPSSGGDMLVPNDRGSESGFTLVELVVVMALLGAMMAIAVSGWSSWAGASAHSGTAREIQTVMRQTQQRAVTEGRAMCVWFDVAADTYTVYRGACDAATRQQLVGPYSTNGSGVEIASPSFTAPSGPSPGVTFYARGTGWPGEVSVTRSGSAKVYVLAVEGLTGHVTLR
jgi:prepilin-type N-terminal cleavage/methylation domain-containing protein